MKKVMMFAALLSGVGLLALPPLQAQTTAAPKACQDLAGVVASVSKGLSGLVATVTKESQDDFERQYHAQVVASRLSIGLSMTNELLDCLDKAAKDPATSKADAAAAKSSADTYTKLKTTLQQDSDTLKAAKNPKASKADIEAFDFSHWETI